MIIARVVQKSTDVVTGDAFNDKEASTESSEPIEFASIVHGTVTYRIAFGVRDVHEAPHIYVATAASRSAIEAVGAGKQSSVTLTLPINHTFTRRYLQLGLPPRQIIFTLWRRQGAIVRQRFIGEITSMGCNAARTEAAFRCESRLGKALLRVIPGVTAGRKCPHPLYGAMCLVDRNAHKVTPAVLWVNGRRIRVDLGAGHGGDWAEGGEFLHPLSGERVTVIEQTDLGGGSTVADLDLQSPIVGIEVGHVVEIYAGCNGEITTCNTKFANRQRFGGFNRMPRKNVFSSTNTGADEVEEL